MKLDDKTTCSQYGKRATPRRHSSQYCIQGEYVSIAQIADRVGINTRQVRNRIRTTKGPVTWDSLTNGSCKPLLAPID